MNYVSLVCKLIFYFSSILTCILINTYFFKWYFKKDLTEQALFITYFFTNKMYRCIFRILKPFVPCCMWRTRLVSIKVSLQSILSIELGIFRINIFYNNRTSLSRRTVLTSREMCDMFDCYGVFVVTVIYFCIDCPIISLSLFLSSNVLSISDLAQRVSSFS